MHHLVLTKEVLTLTVLTVVLSISHYISPYIKRIPWLNQTRFTSFAGGVAVGYVFLHMLPEIVESHDKIHDLLDKVTYMSPFKDLAVFVIALLGFEIFYVLDRLTYEGRITNINASYKLNLVMYFIYNFLITYTLSLRFDAGIFYAILFTIAMGLHFVITDRHFQRYYSKLFGARSHISLISGLVLGCIFALAVPVNIYVAAMLSAFLCGAVLYNAFSEEIALQRQSSMLSFFIGTAIMTLLLAFGLLRW